MHEYKVGQKLKSGFDVFVVTAIVTNGSDLELHCEVEGNPKRTWVVVLEDDGTLPASVEMVE